MGILLGEIIEAIKRWVMESNTIMVIICFYIRSSLVNIVGSSRFCQQSAAGLHELSAGLTSHPVVQQPSLCEKCNN